MQDNTRVSYPEDRIMARWLVGMAALFAAMLYTPAVPYAAAAMLLITIAAVVGVAMSKSLHVRTAPAIGPSAGQIRRRGYAKV